MRNKIWFAISLCLIWVSEWFLLDSLTGLDIFLIIGFGVGVAGGFMYLTRIQTDREEHEEAKE